MDALPVQPLPDALVDALREDDLRVIGLETEPPSKDDERRY